MTKTRFKGLDRGRRAQRGAMNKTEALYADRLDNDPNVARWRFESLKVRITYATPGSGFSSMWFTPDFYIWMVDQTIEIHEVKGGGVVNDASIVRLKAAAMLHPEYTFRLATRLPKSKGGGFDLQDVSYTV